MDQNQIDANFIPYPQRASADSGAISLDGQSFGDRSRFTLASYQKNSKNAGCSIDPAKYYKYVGSTDDCSCTKSKLESVIQDIPTKSCGGGGGMNVSFSSYDTSGLSKMDVVSRSLVNESVPYKYNLNEQSGDFPKDKN